MTQNDVVFSSSQQRAVLLFTQFKTAISSYILSWFFSVFSFDLFTEPVAFTFVVFFRHLFHNCFIQSMYCRRAMHLNHSYYTSSLLPFFKIIIVTEVHFGLACLFESSPDHLEFQTYHSQFAWGFSQGKSKQCTPHTIVINVFTLATIKICIDNQIFLYKVSVSN